MGADRFKRLLDRRIGRKIAGIDTALEFSERDHWHRSLTETAPVLRTGSGSGKRMGAIFPWFGQTIAVIAGREQSARTRNPTTDREYGFRARARRRIPEMTGRKPPSPLLQVDPCCRGGRMDTRTPSTTHLTDEQRVNWLRLIRSDNVGPRGIMAQTHQA